MATPKKKPQPKSPPELPKEMYGYYVEASSYAYPKTIKRWDFRMVDSISKVPPNKAVGIYKLSGTGVVEKTVNISLKEKG